MLKRLFGRLTGSSSKIAHNVISRDEHNVSRRNISRSAIKVMNTLSDSFYEIFRGGGGVRDLLLDGRPKDFDVATSATPEQVKRQFRNSRIIGRRFKIVHVRFGREIIEVTTFRADHSDKKTQASTHAKQDKDGMLLRDNVYGDVRTDAIRRDFTVNALYYTADDFRIHDFVGGIDDIDDGLIRMIGDPSVRYQEDPVRLLRAVRFAAKLDFDIEAKTAAPIRKMGKLLRNIPSARLFEETLKLFMGGYGADCLEGMLEYDLLKHLLPDADIAMRESNIAAELIKQAMNNTDKRINNDQRVTPAFIFAAMLWPAVQKEQARLEAKGDHPVKAHQQAAQNVVQKQIEHTAIPKRFTQGMREIWELQHRLPKRQGKRAESLVEHPRFRAAYDFVLLREQAGENLEGLGKWWTIYQDADTDIRAAMVEKLGQGKSDSNRKRRPRRRKPSTDQ